MWFTFGCFDLAAPLVLKLCGSKPHTNWKAFLKELGRHIAATCFEPISIYLLQRVVVAIQQGNAAAVLGTISRGGGLG